MEKDKIYEVTEEDRNFFDNLVNRQADQVPENIIMNDDGEEINITTKDETPKEDMPELPDWYRPWMSVSWINGVPVRPPTKEEKSMGSWK